MKKRIELYKKNHLKFYKFEKIYSAFIKNNKTILKKVIKNKANLSITGPYKVNMLMIAAVLNESLDIVDSLLKMGFDVNCKNIKNETPLTLAENSKNIDVIKKLRG